MLRRTFLASAAGAAAVHAFASAAGIRLGIDAYSIRSWKWKAPKLLEYAAGLKMDTLQFGGLGDLESFEPAYLAGVKAKADAAKMTLELGLGSICPTTKNFDKSYGTAPEYLTKAIRIVHGLGGNIIKTYVGASVDRQGPTTVERHIEETLKVLAAVRPLAKDLGVKIAMENHSGDLLARELRGLIETAGREWVGCCYDSGNPAMTLEDPVRTLEILGPYTITSHMRDMILFEHPRGAAWQWTALGDGIIDWPAIMERYRALCPGAAMLLENITGRPPRVVPFLEPDFWKAFPNHNASDFATYVALARRGRPLMAPMIIADVPGQQPPEFRDALRQQQLTDLEKGLAFAKDTLGAGINCRG
ncbi:MAG TPA: sugar phosphate isomerase/epimerase [Bryobacteraceae bacterium]|nr:sugar phosphate isomerase/epimerase [Bryobacteraceae bacterium]